MKLRVSEDAHGRMPKLRFRAQQHEAAWVPMIKKYVDYKPEFYFD